MFDILAQVVTSAAIVSLTVFCIYKIQTHARNAQAIVLTEYEGIISPGKGTAWLTIVFGIIMILSSLFAVVVYGMSEIVLGLFLTLMGAAMSGFMAPSLSSIHDVNWNTQYVEGASKMFGPILGKSRTQIQWSDITSTGTTVTQYWYVQTNEGRRIYWSYLYNGHGAFAQVLARKCPDLKLPF